MAHIICVYRYTYGAGNTPNREIRFFGDNQQQQIHGEIYEPILIKS